MDGVKLAGFEFFYNFDSANLGKVEYVPQSETTVSLPSTSSKTFIPETPEVEFNIWTKPDCCGTEFENGNRTWFYFGMKANVSSVLVKINMVDINRQTKMYSQGMAPVYKVVPGKSQWDRIRDKPVFKNEGNIFTLSFKYRTPENPQSVTYFAFTYPFSYTDIQHLLNNYDSRFGNTSFNAKDDIYYVRECLCYSLEKRRIDLITISSYYNISAERETRLINLFPDENTPRPFKFINKKVVFISARVHPGETPASFVFNGILSFLLNREDMTAAALRRLYVFKLIPCLNPDGVARGHYRTDTRGVNLNRMYLNPKFSLHPSIYASRALIRYYHFGFEKEDEVEKSDSLSDTLDSSSVGEDGPQNDSKLSNRVSHMTLEEKKINSNTWCSKCKQGFLDESHEEQTVEDVIANDENNPIGAELCCRCSSAEVVTLDNEDSSKSKSAYSHGDANCNESGLYLYLDLHGHASKKGIFMYGNHFEDLDLNVECMLLPKIMSINNHNFHFTACNFTERNMYLRDRRDGMSREGSGRVAVLKITGLVRSYTLECNYNTGRLVNVLPPTIRESSSKVHTLPVPPKYTPYVYEEVGRALGASILDLTGQNPNTRIPNSEFHTLNGIRDWLRLYCVNELGETQTTPPKIKLRNYASLHAQGKTVRAVIIKTRSSSAKTTMKKTFKGSRSTSVPIDRKENIAFHSKETSAAQPSCSHVHHSLDKPPTRPVRLNKVTRPKSKRDGQKRKGLSGNDKQLKAGNTVQNAKQRPKTETCTRIRSIKDANKKPPFEQSVSTSRIQIQEICFVKGSEGKKVIAKYKREDAPIASCSENLIVSWDATSSHAQVFSEKESCLDIMGKPLRDAATSNKQQSSFRVHNFARTNSNMKIKRSKRNLRRLTTAPTESPSKMEKVKKRKKAKGKLG